MAHLDVAHDDACRRSQCVRLRRLRLGQPIATHPVRFDHIRLATRTRRPPSEGSNPSPSGGILLTRPSSGSCPLTRSQLQRVLHLQRLGVREATDHQRGFMFAISGWNTVHSEREGLCCEGGPRRPGVALEDYEVVASKHLKSVDDGFGIVGVVHLRRQVVDDRAASAAVEVENGLQQ
ncbi:MAG: hypothetical protein ACI80F_002580 [Natronomonas sp.]|jgi:hypothetical protein